MPDIRVKRLAASIAAIFAWCLPGAVAAQSVPTIDTEDATFGSAKTSSSGWFHPLIGFDLRNGDFARANYDDDAADLKRLPFHAQVGFAVDMGRNARGDVDTWLVVRSSNGFHSSSAMERTRPRSWYESNNLVAVVTTPAKGLRTGLVYTIKTSPNGVSGTTHEASLTAAYDGDAGVGALHPYFAATVRPKGTHGVFNLAGIEPEFALGRDDGAPKISVPLAVGVGWGGFYQEGSGARTYGSAGLALAKGFMIGDTRWGARAEVVALIRDDRLAALSGPLGETSNVVPLATLSLSMAY